MMSTEEPDPNDVWKYYRELGEAILFPQGSVHDVPEAGDTIFVQTQRGFYHYGIYMGKVNGVNTVIDNDAYDGMDGNMSSIREKTFAQFAHSERVLIIVFEETPEAAIKRRSKALEMARLLKDRHEGQNLYDLINFNCQHFVSVCQGSSTKENQIELLKKAAETSLKFTYNAAIGLAEAVSGGTSALSSGKF